MELSKKQMTVVVTLSMLLAGGIMYSEDTTYYCESRDIVADCDEGLSSTGLTCKISNKPDWRCNEGWEHISNVGLVKLEQNTTEIKPFANGCEYTCPIIDGKVDKFTNCYCGDLESDLGELIHRR